MPTQKILVLVCSAVVLLAAGCRGELRPAQTTSSAEPAPATTGTSATATGVAPSSTSGPPVAHSPAAPTAAAAQPSISLTTVVPGDITFGGVVTLPALQRDFDVFSWDSFIALNWPAGKDGKADPSKQIGKSDAPTVWENYSDVTTVFLPNGATPKWRAPQQVPAVCKSDYTAGMKVVSQVGKTPTVLSDVSQPFNTGPLIDQNGVYSRFQIVINKPMFDYILGNTLYSRAGQQAFKGEVKFPCGTNPPAPATGVEGTIMVKSSWKVIDPSERARFHTAEALVYSPASENPSYPASCSKQLLGLVGLHIAHKTAGSSQWIWSTFEHIDNAPTEADVQSGHLKPAYNYYDPKCPAAKCPPNQTPPRPWDPTKKSAFHSQVVRINSFKGNEFAPESAAARNAEAWKVLAGVNPKSVWLNYELISTQWPTNPGGPCAPKPGDQLGTPAPIFLANTTLETYVQGMVPAFSSSCIFCHNNAATTSKIPSDFTYVLQRAQ